MAELETSEHLLVELRKYSQDLVAELLRVYAKIHDIKETN